MNPNRAANIRQVVRNCHDERLKFLHGRVVRLKRRDISWKIHRERWQDLTVVMAVVVRANRSHVETAVNRTSS